MIARQIITGRHYVPMMVSQAIDVSWEKQYSKRQCNNFGTLILALSVHFFDDVVKICIITFYKFLARIMSRLELLNL